MVCTMSRRLRATPLALLLGAVAAGAIALAVSALGTDTPAARATERTVTVKQGVVQATVSGSGNLEPSATRDLSFGGSGTVTAVYVEASDTVEKGQLLAKVDPTDADVALAQAQADLVDAQDALDDAQDAQDADSDSSTSESATTSVASAQAKVDAAQLTVDDAQDAVDGTRLHAPVAGTIADVGVSVGDAVSSGASSSTTSDAAAGATTESSSSSAAMTLVQIDRYKMTVSLGESDIGKVKAGQMATVTVDAAGDEQLAARVTDVDLLSSSASSSSSTDASSSSSAVSYSVTLKLTQSAKALKSGMSATAEIVTSQATGLTVPTAAISGTAVTVVKNGVRAKRQVQAGVAGDATTVVTSGLTAGETVVVTSASAAAGAAASSSGSSATGSQQQSGSGSGLSGALGGGTSGGGITGGPPGGGDVAGGGVGGR